MVRVTIAMLLWHTVPSSELNNIHVLRHLILTTALQGECDYRLHFADQEAEAHRE